MKFATLAYMVNGCCASGQFLWLRIPFLILILSGCSNEVSPSALSEEDTGGAQVAGTSNCRLAATLENAASFIKTMKDQYRALDDFVYVDFGALQNIDGPFSWGGQGNNGFLTADLRDQPVVIKIFRRDTRSQSQLVNQARWMMAWNLLKLGPTFHGFVTLRGTAYENLGDIGLVMKRLSVAGRVFSERDVVEKLRPLPGLKFTKYSIAQLRQIAHVYEGLKAFGVCVKADDAQFMTSPTGAIVPIDPEYFEVRDCPIPNWMDAQYVYDGFADYFTQFISQ